MVEVEHWSDLNQTKFLPEYLQGQIRFANKGTPKDPHFFWNFGPKAKLSPETREDAAICHAVDGLWVAESRSRRPSR